MLRAASYEDSRLVFTTGKGTPLDARNIINRSFDSLLEKARLRPIRFRELRYSCLSLLV
jgi:integrase